MVLTRSQREVFERVAKAFHHVTHDTPVARAFVQFFFVKVLHSDTTARPPRFSASPAVEEFWRDLILRPRLYAACSLEACGEVVHYDPDDVVTDDMYMNTLTQLQLLGFDTPHDVWPTTELRERIFAKDLFGHTYSVPVNMKSTVATLKQQLVPLLKTSSKKMQIIFNGKVANDTASLHSLGMVHDSTVYTLMKPENT